MGGTDLDHTGIVTGALLGTHGAAFLEIAVVGHVDGVGDVAGDVIQLGAVVQGHGGLGLLQTDGVGMSGILEDLVDSTLLDKVKDRGFIREGYQADLVLVKPNAPHTVDTAEIVSKCAWSPFEGHTFSHDITHTWVNGRAVYENGTFDDSVMGQRMLFNA